MELRPGMYLQGDKYRIIKVLGNGGFGITYLAEHEMAGRNVCIKEFFPKEYYNRTSDSRNVSLGSQGSAPMMDAYKAKFIKEAKTIARLDHPNIIHIHDVFAENNTAYYVMEYIEGEPFSEIVSRDGAMKEADAVEYIRIVASAIAYIHEQRIMHLDIKPANVMLRKRDNRAILIDFGLSKQYDGDGHQTSSTPVGISAGYAPMEQYQQGGVKEFSPETDIYSLGATLYTLVTGAIPPQAAIIADEGFPELPSHLSAGVRRAIETSMLIQRRRRPHSIEEFLSLLDNNDIDIPIVPSVQSTKIVANEETIIPKPQTQEEKTQVPPTPKKDASNNGYNRQSGQRITDNIVSRSNNRNDDNNNLPIIIIVLVVVIALVVGAFVLFTQDSSAGKSKQRSGASMRHNTMQEQDSIEFEAIEEVNLIEESHTTVVEETNKTYANNATDPSKKPQPQTNNSVPNIEVSDEKIETNIVFTDDADDFDDFDIVIEEKEEEIEEEIFITVEEMPTFQGGGLPEFRNWVQQNVKYPQIALENGIQGNVVVQFVVGTDGKISNFKVLQSPDKTLSDATIAVLNEGNKLKRGWKPGKQRGKAVKVSFTMPVRFVIQN